MNDGVEASRRLLPSRVFLFPEGAVGSFRPGRRKEESRDKSLGESGDSAPGMRSRRRYVRLPIFVNQ